MGFVFEAGEKGDKGGKHISMCGICGCTMMIMMSYAGASVRVGPSDVDESL